MPEAYSAPVTLTDPDLFRQLLRGSMTDWNINLYDSHPLRVEVALREAGDVRAMTLTSHSFRGLRGPDQVARDLTSYVALIYPQAGRIICRESSGDVTLEPGEIFLADIRNPLEIIVPDRVSNLALNIPTDRFQERFPQIDLSSGCLHLRPRTNVVSLLAGCLDTLARKVFPRAEEPATPAVDIVMDVLGAALLDLCEPADRQAALFGRIARFIDAELKDSALTATAIAQAQGISVRYLHLLFSRRGKTVRGWIRTRRLEACRRALFNRRERCLTELAFEWGFSDAAHLSRAFKSAYGISPSNFRRLNRRPIRLP